MNTEISHNTIKAIADKLNSEGIQTKGGKKWTPVRGHRALKSRKRG